MKRATILFDDDLHQSLKIHSMATRRSISEIVSEAVRVVLREDCEDLAVADKRNHESPISYETFLKQLGNRARRDVYR